MQTMISFERFDPNGPATLTRIEGRDVVSLVLNAEISRQMDPTVHDLHAVWRCAELCPSLVTSREAIELH